MKVLRCTCRSFRDVLDNKNPDWQAVIDKYCTPLVPLSWGKSLGTTALMVRSSALRNTCICCRLWFSIKVNKFYDVRICGVCSKKNLFRVVTLRKACFNYFLDYELQKQNAGLIKIKRGRSFSVLLSHIRIVAQEKYPDGLLETKINARFAKALKTEMKKQLEKEKRVQDLSLKFCDVLWLNPARVDAVLRDQAIVTGLITSFGSKNEVFGDLMERRVKASTSVSVAARNIYDYAAMLTYMRKLNLLDFRYGVTGGHRCHPNNIFRHHIHAGLHFYELAREHADARDELASRLVHVETYMLRKRPTQSERASLCIAMCAEDSVNYRAEDFECYVVGSKGNPVEISRQLRKRDFLHQNHLVSEINHFLHHGYDYEKAQRLAKQNVLYRTKGYPPMKRVCFINLTIRPK